MKKLNCTVNLGYQELVENQSGDTLKSVYVVHQLEVGVDDETPPELAADELIHAYKQLYGDSTSVEIFVNYVFSLNPGPHSLLPDQARWYEALPVSESFTTADALEIAEELEFAKRTAEALLTDSQLFQKLRRGLYKRLH